MLVFSAEDWERCRDTLRKGIAPRPNPLPVEHVAPCVRCVQVVPFVLNRCRSLACTLPTRCDESANL